MMLPTTVRTSVSPGTLAKVTRLFNGTPADVLAELLQNARRAGASCVRVAIHRMRDGRAFEPDDPAVHDGSFWLTVADNGCGVADPAAPLTLGSSGWEADTLRAEDPAGMGLFALAGRPVRVASRGPAGAWSVSVGPEDWTSGADLAVERGQGPAERGTVVSVEAPEGWAANLKAEVQRAALYYPLPVTFNGEEAPRCAFLAKALRVEEWRGLKIGVVQERGWSGDPRINFHGVTVPCVLPQVAEMRGETWSVLADVVDCPELQLVLPARKEVVATPFLDELREACERALYRYFATRDHHSLPYEEWRRAAALGVELPPAAMALSPWSPATNDGDPDHRFRRRWNDESSELPAEPLIMADVGPDLEQSLARALTFSDPELRTRLVEACPDFAGYSWYDALPRVVGVVGTVTRGAATWATDDEAAPPESGVVDRASIALTIASGEISFVRPLATDVLLVASDEGWSDEPDQQHVFVTPNPRLDPVDLTDAIVAAFFMASDDRDADSWETQHDRYEREALDFARRLLLGDGEADIARIRDAIRDRIAWLVPKGRELRVRYDAASLDVSLAPLGDDAATGRS